MFMKNFLFALMLCASISMLMKAVFFGGDVAVYVGGVFMGVVISYIMLWTQILNAGDRINFVHKKGDTK